MKSKGIIQRVHSTHWVLDRFGVTPRKLFRRWSGNNSSSILCITMPKSGTHLLERVLCLYPAFYRPLVPTLNLNNISRYGGLEGIANRARPGQVFMSHLRCSQDYIDLLSASRLRPVLMVRDPRDILVSEMFFIRRETEHRHHKVLAEISDIDACLRLVIQGNSNSGFPSARERLLRFVNWKDSGFHVVHFEHLVGARGGGDDEQQRQTVRDLYAYLQAPIDETGLQGIMDSCFSSASPTFRSGQIGSWRNRFNADHRQLFDEQAGDLVGVWGYERC